MSQVFDNKQPYPITNKQPYPFPSKAPGPVRPTYIPLKEAPKIQNKEYISKIFETVNFGDISEIKLAMSKTNTPLNIRNDDGKGLIHYVLENDNIDNEDDKLEVIKFLLEHGASLSYDKYNVCPLHLACKKQYAKITKFLLKSSDVNACDSNGMNALHYLVQGDVKQCTDDKKIGKIIEKDPKKGIIMKEMKEISVEILNKLNGMKDIIKPLNDKLLKLDKYYPENFDTTNLIGEIGKKLIEDKKSKEEKKIEIENLINSHVYKVKADMKNKFNDVLGVIGDDKIEMLKNNDDLMEKLVTNNDNNVGKIIGKMETEIEEFEKYINDTLANIKTGETRFIKNIGDIKKASEKSNSGPVKDSTPLNDPEDIKNLTTKMEKDEYRKINPNDNILFPYLDINKHINIEDADYEFSNTKKISFWITEIKTKIALIKGNCVKLNNNADLSQIYEIVVINILTEVFNIMQCCVELLNISGEVKKFNTAIVKFITDNQMFGPDKKKITAPPTLFTKSYSAQHEPNNIYIKCNNIINEHLNKLIFEINNNATIQSIKKINKPKIPYNNIFNIQLKHIENLPKNLDSYKKEITDVYDNISKQRIYIYKKYFHVIDSTYSPIYICNGCDQKGRKGYLIEPVKDGNVDDGKALNYNDKPMDINYFDDIELDISKPTTYKIGKIAQFEKITEFTGDNLNEYANFLKLFLIQKIIAELNNEKKTDFIYKLQKLGKVSDVNYEDLFLDYVIKITNNIVNKSIENSIYSSINDYIHNVIGNDKKKSDINIHPIELNYNVGLNGLFEKFIDEINKKEKLDVQFGQTLYPINLIEDETKPQQNFPIYDQNYKMNKKENNYKCYDINYDIVELLYNASINMNKKDITGSSPLFYAIEINNHSLIGKLLGKSIISVVEPSIKNNFGITPYKHFINLYKIHLDQFVDKGQVEMSQMIKKFTQPITIDIKDTMQKNPKYKNNIIRYLDIIFPQLLIMYNNMLYFYAQSYRNNWSYVNNEILRKKLSIAEFDLNQYKLPIIKYIEDNLGNLINGSIKFNYVEESKKKNIKKRDIKIKQKEGIFNILQSLQGELKKYEGLEKSNQYDHIIEQLKNKIKYVASQKHVLDREILNLKHINDEAIINPDNNTNNNVTNIKNKIKEIHLEDKSLTPNLTSLKHDSIFNNVKKMHKEIAKDVICDKDVNGKDICDDYILYNELWKNFIGSNDLNDMSNIHLKLIMHETDLIKGMKNITNNNYGDAKNIYEDFEIINGFYEKILVNTINTSNELPYNYDYEENYVLAETLDIITHIVKHTLCSNLYYTVIKVLTKYFIELNKEDIKKDMEKKKKENIDLKKKDINLKTIIYDKIQNSDLNKNIHDYVLLQMPKLLVKKKLDIYENDYEETVLDVDKLFDKLLNIITSSNEFPFPKDSTLDINLKGVIFEYYKELFNLVIPKMKIFIDDYNKFILNESRFVKCAMLINKHVMKLKY